MYIQCIYTDMRTFLGVGIHQITLIVLLHTYIYVDELVLIVH